MRKHLDEGVLQAYLDGELHGAELEAAARHLEACEPCREELEVLERCGHVIQEALKEVDLPPPDPGMILWDVRRRKAASRARTTRRRTAAAASLILLLGAGLAAAAPGSPIRDWWEGRQAAPVVVPSPAPTDGAVADEGVEVSVLPSAGVVLVSLESVRLGLWLEVEVADVERVTVAAPSGARFGTGAGHVRIEGEQAVDGTIRVELPARARSEVRVDGQTFVIVEDGQVRRPGPQPSQSVDGVLRFEFPGPGALREPGGTSSDTQG